MKAIRKQYTIREIVKDFEYSELEGKGLFGLSGKLTIQPEYQRHYIYDDGKKDVAVISSILRRYPLGVLYFNKLKSGQLEVLDGQQRITSIGRFTTNKLHIVDDNGMPQYFESLPEDQQSIIMDTELLVYECEGAESEIKEWFQTVNIAGVELRQQELLNAVYSGPFVTLGKAEFSNSQNSNIQMWGAYIRGVANRQDYWEKALEWVSKGKDNIGEYMSRHRGDENILEVKTYFNAVIEWVSKNFENVYDEMCGLEWGRLYEMYHQKKYDKDKLAKQIQILYGDASVRNRRGIWEFLLGGAVDKKLLDLRVFDEVTKKSQYVKQTSKAKLSSTSNCSLCSIGRGANVTKIWRYEEMEADHIDAWSMGGNSRPENCQMLCKTHNRAKGNR
jgi:hypothetical protein